MGKGNPKIGPSNPSRESQPEQKPIILPKIKPTSPNPRPDGEETKSQPPPDRTPPVVPPEKNE